MNPTIVAVVNQPASYWGFVTVGYGAAVVALGGFAIRTITRGRRLSRGLPPEKRRWL